MIEDLMTENVMTEIFDGRNITTFLSSLGGAGMLQEVLAVKKKRNQAVVIIQVLTFLLNI